MNEATTQTQPTPSWQQSTFRRFSVAPMLDSAEVPY